MAYAILVGGGADLICAAGNRTKLTITGFGILNGPHDYGGYPTYNTPGLAGVEQCRARRSPRASLDPSPGQAAPQLRPGRRLRDHRQPVRSWHKGTYPGLILARRLKRKAARSGYSSHASTEQRIGERHARLRTSRKNQQLLSHPGNPAAPMPPLVLPGHRS